MDLLPDLLNQSSAIWGGIVAVLGILYKSIKSLLEFNDEYLQKRPIKKLTFLLEQTKKYPSNELSDFLSKAIHQEVFKSAFGHDVSQDKAEIIIKLQNSGLFSLSELKACYIYISTKENGEISITPGKMGYIILTISSLLILLAAIFTFLALFKLITTINISSIITALTILLLYLLSIWIFGRDIREVIVAIRAKEKLKKCLTSDYGVNL